MKGRTGELESLCSFDLFGGPKLVCFVLLVLPVFAGKLIG